MPNIGKNVFFELRIFAPFHMFFSLFGCLYIRRCGSYCFVSEKLGGSQAVLLQKHHMNSRGRQTYKEHGNIWEHRERKGILLTA